ncbi:VWA domain-containing protein [Novosphingobium sp. ZN18A2]|uniref:vWA domain-containing protein n=1 Tax=Novosphingobium sp. ZN18A2 TaxID=3079861 RepID=UPI0030CC5712
MHFAKRPAFPVSIALITAMLSACAAEQRQVASNSADSVVVTGQRKEAGTAGDASMAQPPSPRGPAAPLAPPPPAPAMMAAPQAGQYVRTRPFVPPVLVPADPGRERYDGKDVSPVHLVAQEPVSTFSIDVDTGAYANARRFLEGGQMPPRDAVRTEEMINYFRYDYPRPDTRETPFSVTTDVAKTPWNARTKLLRIGLRGYDLPAKGRPPANLVFLVDVSGSMGSADKLPLVKTALSALANELGRQDRVSIVVYAGAAGMVLEPTNDTAKIRAALNRLHAGGSTAGGAGLQLAYRIAEDNFVKGGVNRILLATDGDFNVGVSDRKSLIRMVEDERDKGVTLTTLGFGTGNYNEAMMEQIADHGNGNYSYIDSALEARKVLAEEMSSTLFTIARDVKIQVEFNPAAVSQYRLLGYENRALREEDFDNDLVDAGEIGAGHQVTAIYEIVPAGSEGWIAPHRYDALAASGKAREMAYVKLRYKLPDGDSSRLIERPVAAALMRTARTPSGDFAFAAAVAAYGQKLRADPLLYRYSFADIAGLAGRQDDYYRQEFIHLARLAGSLKAE